MDTIDIKFKCNRDITTDEREVLKKSRSWIHKVRRGRYHDEMIVVICLPKYFFQTNAYLITTEEEVKEVIGTLLFIIEGLRIGIEEATVIRVDYPFTYIMEDNHNFNSYRNILYILSKATPLSKTKNFEDSKTEFKETFTFGDNTNLNKAKNKVTIYDQARKIYDKDKCPEKSNYLATLSEFPELERRMRVEVAMSVDIPLKDLRLKEVKKKAYEWMEKYIFNEEILKNYMLEQAIKLAGSLKKERLSESFSRRVFVEEENPLEYTYVKEAGKIAYEVISSREKFLKIAKSSLRNKEVRDNVIIIRAIKVIQIIKIGLRKEKMKPTK